MEHTFELRSFKAFRTPDGGGYNAVLFVDGKRAADVFDAGNGGGPVLALGSSHETFDLCNRAGAAIFQRDHPGEADLLGPQEWLLAELAERVEIGKEVKRGIVIDTGSGFTCIRPRKPTTLDDLLANNVWRSAAEIEHGGKIVNDKSFGPLTLKLAEPKSREEAEGTEPRLTLQDEIDAGYHVTE